ncbi:MAG: hypothetical protein NT069_14445 [Planctomycetota bacterium]|nr:hypothetical protein [Planctomycetota bacterium]
MPDPIADLPKLPPGLMRCARTTPGAVCRVAVALMALTAGVAWADDPVLVPPAHHGPAAASQRTERALKELFAAGYTPGPKQLAAVQKLLAPLKQELRDDPRLDYLLGVVELRQGQLKPAAAQFESYIRRSEETDWSAWQALIWALFADKQYEAGLNRLIEYGQLVAGMSQEDEATDAQRDAAQWMGEMVEGLEQTVEASQKKSRNLIEEQSGRLRELLNDELYESFEAGRENVRERVLALDWKVDTAQGGKARKDEEAKRKRSRRVTEQFENAEEERKEKERSADEWKKWLEKNLTDVDKQLGRLEKDYRYLEQRSKSLMQSILTLEQEAAIISQWPVLPGRDQYQQQQQQQGMGYFQNDAQKSSALTQLQTRSYVNQIEYNMSLARLSDTSRQGSEMQRTRAQIVQRYEKATGDLSRQKGEIDQWESRLNAQQRKLATKPPAAKKPAGKPVPRSFKTLCAIDFEVEQQRVYAQFGLKPPLKQRAPGL